MGQLSIQYVNVNVIVIVIGTSLHTGAAPLT
jgi:hypothetical protein